MCACVSHAPRGGTMRGIFGCATGPAMRGGSRFVCWTFIVLKLGMAAGTAGSLSPFLRGEGWGEGPSDSHELRGPSPGSLRDPTSPRKRGEVKKASVAPPQTHYPK